MVPARPVVCEPVDVSTPVIGWPPSVNSGNGALPPVSEVAVAVADSDVTVLPLALALSTCSTVPDGLANCSLPPNALLSCDTTELRPPEKSTPIIWLLEFGGEVCNGSEPPCPSETIVMLCVTLPESV